MSIFFSLWQFGLRSSFLILAFIDNLRYCDRMKMRGNRFHLRFWPEGLKAEEPLLVKGENDDTEGLDRRRV